MIVLNPAARRPAEFSEWATLLGPDAPALVRSYLGLPDEGCATPLYALHGLAASLGIRRIFAKQESSRLGLTSFKALGAGYAVARLVHAWAEQELGRARSVSARRTITCATDGNHGCAVAANAQRFGCRAVIFVHSHVPMHRLERIRRFGAELVVVPGSYDDAVAECTRAAAQSGWQVVSDTSWPGYEVVPGHVMQGYTVIADECVRILDAAGERPTHVFLQAGVGGLASSVAAHLGFRWPSNRPKIVVVEPDRANCLLQSFVAGRWLHIGNRAPTNMSMLECYQPSFTAWRILQQAADAFMDIPDESAALTRRRVAPPIGADAPIVSTESGLAGLGGLMTACTDPELRRSLELTKNSSALVLVTEGPANEATDALLP